VHLTGIAWQKRSHTKYFDNQKTYKMFYKLIVHCLRCSSTALAIMLVWAEPTTTGVGGVGGTNNNCGTKGGWNDVKKEVCGTAGSTSSLSVRTVVPSILRFLSNKSKEQASFWRRVGIGMVGIRMPTKEEWDHNILELCTVFASADVKTAWDLHIGDMLGAAKEEGVTGAAAQ
jgi:hypothetical protein